MRILETPLRPVVKQEGKILLFGPPLPYIALIRAVYAIGGLITVKEVLRLFGLDLYSIYGAEPGQHMVSGDFFLGVALLFAGLFATLSLDFVQFDLRERVFRWRSGPGLLRLSHSGRFSDIQLLSVSALPSLLAMGTNTAFYGLYLHLNNRPGFKLLLTTQTMAQGSSRAPFLLQNFIQYGSHVAREIGVAFEVR